VKYECQKNWQQSEICIVINVNHKVCLHCSDAVTVSCFSEIQTSFTFLVLAHPGSPGQRAVKRVRVCVNHKVAQPSISDVMGYSITHTHPHNGPLSGTTRVSRYQKGKTNLDFTEARDSEWQWHRLGRMQVCISLQTDNHASTPPLSFLQAGCPSCRPTNSVKALKAESTEGRLLHYTFIIQFSAENRRTFGEVMGKSLTRGVCVSVPG